MTTATTQANGITIAYETFGELHAPPMVLVMGLGAQMLVWPDDFCRELAGRGFLVVRFDNRDVGLSTHMSHAPEPDILAAITTGDVSSASYRLEDMADDTVGLMDALGIATCHLVGASMGGMIVQTVAVRAPERIRSLTSIMSTPSPQAGPPTDEALLALMEMAPASRQEAADLAVKAFEVIGSPAYPADEDELRAVAMAAYDRDPDTSGTARQLLAIIASGDRTEALREVRIPTLVIHGDADPLVQPQGGRATAEAVPGAELLVLAGVGHDLPRALWGTIIDAIVDLAQRADARAGAEASA